MKEVSYIYLAIWFYRLGSVNLNLVKRREVSIIIKTLLIGLIFSLNGPCYCNISNSHCQ